MVISPELVSATSSLYCAEDADAISAAADDYQPLLYDDDDEWAPPQLPDSSPPVADLLSAEADHMPRDDYLSRFRSRSLDSTARQDAVSWILKVNEFYRFRPVTACLAVNYLDRFLSAHSLPGQDGKGVEGGGGGGWAMQLVAVACVAVAAKMEETRVPLLLDLQVLDPRFVFEPRTVCRMELLLMAALRWRMRSITPFDFLHPFASAVLPSISFAAPRCLFSRAADLILCTHRVVDFLGFRPSEIAAGALLCAAGESVDWSAVVPGDSLYKWVSKEMVNACLQLMEAYMIDTCPSAQSWAKPILEPPAPQSPVGVLDAAACGSCDTQKTTTVGEPSCADPPQAKRRRLGDSSCTEEKSIGTTTKKANDG